MATYARTNQTQSGLPAISEWDTENKPTVSWVLMMQITIAVCARPWYKHNLSIIVQKEHARDATGFLKREYKCVSEPKQDRAQRSAVGRRGRSEKVFIDVMKAALKYNVDVIS